MKVEIWSDFICPFCYIGKRHFEKALDSFPHKHKITIEYKAYELSLIDQDAQLNVNEPLPPSCSISLKRTEHMNAQIRDLATNAGVICDVDCIEPTNTFDAHRLAKFASSRGKESLMIKSLLKAYFTDAKQIGDHETLIELAGEIGLNEAEVRRVLTTDVYSKDVHDDEQLARQIGVNGVPFFVFNEEYALSGAQSIDIFVQVLEKVWEEFEETERLKTERRCKTSYCTDEGCFEDD